MHVVEAVKKCVRELFKTLPDVRIAPSPWDAQTLWVMFGPFQAQGYVPADGVACIDTLLPSGIMVRRGAGSMSKALRYALGLALDSV